MYEVLLERGVEKQLDKLPATARSRIITALKKLSKDPRPAGCRKLSGSVQDWRLRVGAYRILYEIDDQGKTVLVNWIGHRKEAY